MQRDCLRYDVYRNGLLTSDLEVMNISESAGAAKLDTAQLLYKDLLLEGRAFHSQIVCEEIEIVDPNTDEVVHWGKIGLVPAELGDGELVNVVSRTEKFHLGNQVDGIWVWNPIKPLIVGGDGGGPELVAENLIFNPLIDGKITGNLNDSYVSGGLISGESPGHPLFLSHESVRTTAARALQGANTTMWPLSTAIHYLLQTLNADETYVSNPSYETISAAINDEEDLLHNTSIPNGTYLADALDMILEPLGYRWHINRTALGSRVFQFFGRRAGELVNVHHQPMGSQLDLAAQNVEAAGLRFDVTNLANQVKIIGGFYSYEVTVELARGWPDSQDNADELNMIKGAELFEYYKNAYRLWVLNEAGDYIGTRAEIDGVFTADFRTALQDTFGDNWKNNFVPKRREWQPTLTLNENDAPIGKTRGIELEYHNPNFDPEFFTEEEWLPLPNLGASLLDQECSIYFGGDFPITEEALHIANRADIRLRATFTLVSDKRLESLAVRQDDSPQTDVLPLTIDAASKFRFQQVSPLSKYYGGEWPSLEQMDLDEINAFAERLRQTWDLMDVGGAIQLEGLDAQDGNTTYKVGQRVQAILGKNLSFRAKAETEEYPQIVAIERNMQTQTMTLHLQRFTQPVVFDDGSRGKSHSR